MSSTLNGFRNDSVHKEDSRVISFFVLKKTNFFTLPINRSMVHNFLSSLSRFADGVCLFKTEQKAFLRLTDDFFPAYNGHDLFALHCIQKNADARSPVQTEQAMPSLKAWGRAVLKGMATG